MEDSEDYVDSNELRVRWFWSSFLNLVQWQFYQAGRGLLPTFHQREGSPEVAVRGLFAARGFPNWWEAAFGLWRLVPHRAVRGRPEYIGEAFSSLGRKCV